MKHFISRQIGRTFIIRMERGDYLLESLAELARKEKIKNAVLVCGIATFDEVKIRMATTVGFPLKYTALHLKEPLELASLDGTIINYEPHVHGVVGNTDRTWAGHLSDGCRILYLGEVVVQELLGNDLVRKEDGNGVKLIYGTDED